MIGYLAGQVKWKSDNKLIITVDGTGYLVELTGFSGIPARGKNIELFIYTYVREDALRLYGFSSMKERELFKLLLGVSRIGPSAASGILSTLAYERFIKAIMEENIAVLKEVSGIGPKTARRLILELKGKIDELALDFQLEIDSDISREEQAELYEALTGLGYSRREIDGALDKIDLSADLSLEDKIKRVLSYLGRE